MFVHESKIRVRYAETDQMKYVYYGNYARYFEIGRVEALRSLGLTYKSLEERGIVMPVLELKSKYIKPAFYDELLNLKTKITKIPSVRIHFEYEIINQKKELIHLAETTLVFFDVEKQKPCSPPNAMINKLSDYFN